MTATSPKTRSTNSIKFSLDRILAEDSLSNKKGSDKTSTDLFSIENGLKIGKCYPNDGIFHPNIGNTGATNDLQKFLDAVPAFGGHGLNLLTSPRCPVTPANIPINPFLFNPLLPPKSQFRPDYLRQLSPNNPFGVLSSFYQRSFSLNHSPELSFPGSFHDAKLLGAAFLDKQISAQQQFLKNAPLLFDAGAPNFFNNDFLNFAMNPNLAVGGKKLEHGSDISPENLRGSASKRKADQAVLRNLEHSPEMSNSNKKRMIPDCVTPKSRGGQYLGLLGELNPMDDHISDDPIGYREDEVIRMESLMTPEAVEKLSKIPNLIGDYICQLCKNKYMDAFQLAQHKCSNIMQVEYKCPECAKKFNCPANLASHRRWHRPKTQTASSKLSGDRQIQNPHGDYKKNVTPPGGFRQLSPASEHIGENGRNYSGDNVKKCKNCHRVFKKLLFLEKHQMVCNKTFEMQSVAEPMISMEDSCFSITKEATTPIGVKAEAVSPLDGLLRIVDKAMPHLNQTTPIQGPTTPLDVITTPLGCFTPSSKLEMTPIDTKIRNAAKASKCLF